MGKRAGVAAEVEGDGSTARATGVEDLGETDVMGNPGMPIGLLAARGASFSYLA